METCLSAYLGSQGKSFMFTPFLEGYMPTNFTMSSLRSFEIDDDLASDVGGMIQFVSDEHSATSLVLSNMVAQSI